ncbi:MAG: hypothetical protein ACOVKH_00325 [Candidatus Nanopelagicus sp.]|jgi:hypothetical protein
MIKRIQKLLVLIVVAATLTGCGSGRTAETRMIKQVTDGVEGQSNEIRVRNLLIVKNELSEGILVGTLVNWSDEVDAITGISINNLPTTVSSSRLELRKNKPVIFAGESANADAAAVITQSIGQRIPVIITFEKAAPITLDALIVENVEWYKDLLRYQPSAVVTP